MIHLRVEAVDEKHIRIRGIPPILAEHLCELPEIIVQRDSPAPRDRLFPQPTSDAKANEEWKEYVEPELRHLFDSALQTVTRDLTTLEPDPQKKKLMRITFPTEHLHAWMSALNQARLILGELHAVTERDMNSLNLIPNTPRKQAIFKIHTLGFLVELLVRHTEAQH